MTADKSKAILTYSCYHTESRSGEQFVRDHALTYQLAGTLRLSDGDKKITSDAGSLILVKRNSLLKFTKTPPPAGDFESISLHFTQETLKNFSLEYDIKSRRRTADPAPVFQFKMNDLMHALVSSLIVFQKLKTSISRQIIELKTKEALLIILEAEPSIREILFDFADPHKIDLEAFMNQNFHFNVHLDQFAYLTGRSLATFKRDFQKAFRNTPGKWLLSKRLHAAHFLIREKNQHPADIYLDLGFEDLSHFSFAFKKEFGQPPTRIGR